MALRLHLKTYTTFGELPKDQTEKMASLLREFAVELVRVDLIEPDHAYHPHREMRIHYIYQGRPGVYQHKLHRGLVPTPLPEVVVHQREIREAASRLRRRLEKVERLQYRADVLVSDMAPSERSDMLAWLLLNLPGLVLHRSITQQAGALLEIDRIELAHQGPHSLSREPEPVNVGVLLESIRRAMKGDT